MVVEKPFTPTAEEAYELIGLAEKNRRLLTVYQSELFPCALLFPC